MNRENSRILNNIKAVKIIFKGQLIVDLVSVGGTV